jgi:hypothetical protein
LGTGRARADGCACLIFSAKASIQIGEPEIGDGNAGHLAVRIVRTNPLTFGQRTGVVWVARELKRLRLAFAGQVLLDRSQLVALRRSAGPIVRRACGSKQVSEANNEQDT